MFQFLDKIFSAMENVEASPLKKEEYSSLSTLLQHFASIPTVDKAWTFKSTSGMIAMIQSPFCIFKTFHFDD